MRFQQEKKVINKDDPNDPSGLKAIRWGGGHCLQNQGGPVWK